MLSLLDIRLQAAVVMIIQADCCASLCSDRAGGRLRRDRMYEKVLQLIHTDTDGLLPIVGQDNLFAIITGEREVTLLAPLVLQQEHNRTAARYARYIKAYLEKELDFTVTLAVGRPCLDCSDWRLSYQDALQALQYKFYLGNSTVIPYRQDRHWPEQEQQAVFIEHETRVLAALRRGEWSQTVSLSLELLAQIGRQKAVRPDILKVRLLELLTLLSRSAVELGVSPEILLDLRVRAGKEIEAVTTLGELAGWLPAMLETVCQLLQERQQANVVRAIARARQYIETYYFREIGLEELAKQVYLSPYYLSRGFSEQTGISFTDYLKMIRIRKAQNLLLNSDKPVAAVAVSVGYSDPNYFSRVFKAVTGKTPQQYRQGKNIHLHDA